MNGPSHCRLTQTDLDLTAADGVVEQVGDLVVARRPNNPGYQWGNHVLLPGPPGAEDLEERIATFKGLFSGQAEVEHVLLRWDGEDLSEPAAARARELGMTPDGGLEMISMALVAPEAPEVVVRRLDMVGEREAIVALNIACDITERTGSADYVLFKERMRQSWWVWHEAGIATWWGAFVDGELVGQCGLLRCSDGLGRYQDVETHPSFRRMGVCSTLVTAAGNHAFESGCRAVLLGADPEGPALGLYRRLGFEDGGTQRCLLLGGEPVVIRPEHHEDQAEVRSMVAAVFGRPEEAEVIEALRGRPGVISLVAERNGLLLGHALFSPVILGDSDDGAAQQGIALGPIAVRPSQQRQGVGSALIQDGLERCREAGWKAAFVLGSPRYYGRFGWRAAATWGLRCRWEVPTVEFQALALVPDGLVGSGGLVSYHPVFDSVG